VTSTSSMASSPLPNPGSPRTATPLPSDEDAGRSLSPSPDTAHAMATQTGADAVPPTGAAEHVPARGAAAPPADEAVNKAPPKGKEKAATGPLRLLDLPVDVLKEIIHQVRVRARRRRGCYAPPPESRQANMVALDSSPTPTT
jgi:hypothetical protein